ncbi:thiolase domain-containing protein [Paraburkholderia youngii]|uniref:Thiolase domain-containing protein n=1 Tax=Paraburkholderia youngii TaxID=2782701 RepID=A0A7Y6K0R3_9BURK|nr:thiolase domain-containing protein [Paraburkholderia youngii]NUY02052.1 thiolase domain-containing protein [Paraburkholderia youngii]
MSLNGAAYIVGAYEHPTRKADELSVLRLHADVAKGALDDAGLTKDDIDGYFCAGDAPGLGTTTVAEYLGLKLRHVDSTECGGSAPILHVAHAAEAIKAGRCNVALITLAGRPRAAGAALSLKAPDPDAPEVQFELPFGPATQNLYGMVAKRHMYEFGTTSEQLAWIKVAASHHAQHNPNAMLRNVVTVEDVINSPMVSDPLHRLDCCVMSDGGGALIVARPEIAKKLNRPLVKVRGTGEAPKHAAGGKIDLSWSATKWSGAAAFAEARLTPEDIKYASLYDSFTITVLMQLEDLGFCKKGDGGKFVMDGNLISGVGKLPFNTDGGGLCNNHPANRGGVTKVIEAVRQLRGEAHPAVQVKDCDIALANGIGGALASRHTAGTLIMERE